MHTVWAILYSENVVTHTKTLNIENTTLRTPKKAREIYFLNGSTEERMDQQKKEITKDNRTISVEWFTFKY